jgi:TolB protein
LLLAGLGAFPASRAGSVEAAALGKFEDHTDVGNVHKAGSVEYDAVANRYVVAGGGDNMWFAKDALHFVWTQMLGDVSLAADIRWPAAGGNAHRKAVLLVRQSLDSDSAYADAALHGNGLTSLQYREVPGGPTREIQSSVSAPRRIRITKEGDYVFMSVAREGESLHSSGGSFRIKLRDPFMVGLGVCAHDDASLEKAVFSNVEIISGRAPALARSVLESTLETVAIASKDRRVVLTARERFAAPTWSSDGKALLFQREGYGGAPGVFSIPAAGGEAPARDAAPARPPSPAPSTNGRYRYRSSDRAGTMQVWRTRADGSDKALVTTDAFANCFPHPSPDGKWLLILSYGEGVTGCPANKDATLRLLPLSGGEIQVLAKLFGGRGTIDLPPWSPDSARVAFVSYRLAAP